MSCENCKDKKHEIGYYCPCPCHQPTDRNILDRNAHNQEGEHS